MALFLQPKLCCLLEKKKNSTLFLNDVQKKKKGSIDISLKVVELKLLQFVSLLMEFMLVFQIVALVCNFSSSNGITPRLSHGELETLFHEFGHALHSLLSRTVICLFIWIHRFFFDFYIAYLAVVEYLQEYQHFSGTRVALDVAETPSNLFEYVVT